jgi:hypothetical protein
MKTVRMIMIPVLVLASLPQMGWTEQASAVERIGQLLEREAHCSQLEGSGLDRQSMHILDSSQLSSSAASFRLAGLQRITRDGYLATVRCATTTECLPFLVVFHCRRPAGDTVERPKASRSKRASIVHTGDRARLEMTITGANLSFPVICLEAGDIGEIIRTRAIATNRIFTAMVTGPGQLRGMEESQ